MIAETRIPATMILAGLLALGCGAAHQRIDDTPVIIEPALRIPADECPYTNVYVAVATNGSKKDAKIATRVRSAYADFLAEHGFRMVGEPNEAYWRAFSMVRFSSRVDSSFAWTVYMMATQDLWGEDKTPRDFVREGDEEDSELSGFMLLREVELVDLEPQARGAALNTAKALIPHASRMCGDWTLAVRLGRSLDGFMPFSSNAEAPEGEDPARAIAQAPQRESDVNNQRDVLVEEMQRIRRERARNLRRKTLEIKAEEEE